MILAGQNSAFGLVVISDRIVATGSPQNFVYQQKQEDTFLSTAIANTYLSISMRIKAVNNKAQQKYGYAPQGPFQAFSQIFDTTPNVTAAALVVTLSAAFPLLTISQVGGLININTGSHYGLEVEYEYTRYLTRTKITQVVDLTTQTGDAVLTGTVDGGSIRYSEAPVASVTPTSTEGELVDDKGFFRIAGKYNIMNAKFIEKTATASVNYQIYI